MGDTKMSERTPLIGLPGRRKKAGLIEGFPSSFADVDVDLYLADYARSVLAAGGIPVNIPFDVDLEKLIGRLDGVLLTGGTDVDPQVYGEEQHPEVLSIEPERDGLEIDLYRLALANDVPVLGICRGLQLMNVAHGGTLHQHVPEHSRYDVDHSGAIHSVQIETGSALGELYGESLEVNSLHHQCVDQLGDGLAVTARAEDGSVEGLEFNERTIAVQWHPELLAESDQDPIFRWLVNTACQVGA